MEVQFSPDQQAFVRQAIDSGRLRREEDAVKGALSLWEERERNRVEVLASVDEAETGLARGEGRAITQESMRELAEDVKTARARPPSRRAVNDPLMGHRCTPQAVGSVSVWRAGNSARSRLSAGSGRLKGGCGHDWPPSKAKLIRYPAGRFRP